MQRLTNNELDALEAAQRLDAGHTKWGRTYTSLDDVYSAYDALPALVAAARQTVPEVIGEKHRDGNWWLVWGGDMDKWVIAHHDELMWQWYRDCGLSVNPTHALPMPPAPEPTAARGEE